MHAKSTRFSMSLTTIILNDQTSRLPLAELLEQAGSGGVEIRDAGGAVVAFLLPPDNDEAWAYAEASVDISRHREEIMAALERRTGITTEELLSKAEAAGKLSDLTQAESVVNEMFREHKQRLTLPPSDRSRSAAEGIAPKAKSG
jgi:hypothetical protein